jgi:peptidoglycan/xylan/chitin deacetylase (PgdA/CDA1 family)
MGVKRMVKMAVALVWYAGQAVLRPFRGRRLTIIFYHAVRPEQRARFERQIRGLARRAELVWPDHVTHELRGKPMVAVTFDDAFRSMRDNGLPVLRQHEVPTTIFVPTGHLGRRPGWQMEDCPDTGEEVMDAGELAAIAGGNVRLGSHSVDHPYLPKLDTPELDRQLTASRQGLEEIVGAPVDILAYPYGEYDERVAARTLAAGYKQSYGVAPEAVDPRGSAQVRGRVEVYADDGPLEYFLKTQGAYAWMPLASRLKRKLRGGASPEVTRPVDVPV